MRSNDKVLDDLDDLNEVHRACAEAEFSFIELALDWQRDGRDPSWDGEDGPALSFSQLYDAHLKELRRLVRRLERAALVPAKLRNHKRRAYFLRLCRTALSRLKNGKIIGTDAAKLATLRALAQWEETA